MIDNISPKYLDPSLPCDDFRKSWRIESFHKIACLFSLYRTAILLIPLFPSTDSSRSPGEHRKKKMNTQVIHFSRCCKEQLFRFTGPIDVGRKRRWLSRCSDIYNLTAYRTRVSLGHSFDPPPPVGEIPFRSVPWVTQGSECYVAWISFFTL